MNLSAYLETKIANWVRGVAMGSPPSGLKLALSNGNPNDDGSGLAEPTAPGYVRQDITLAAPTSDGDGTHTANSGAIVFTPDAGEALGQVTHAAIYDTSDNLLFYGPLDVTRTGAADDTISFDASTILIDLVASFTDYIAEAVINWVRNNAMPAAPTAVTMALSTAAPLFDGSGLAEPTMNGYVRQTVTFGSASSTNGVGTTIANNAGIVFGPDVDAPWGVISHWALFHNNGEMLFNGALAVAKSVTVNMGFGLSAGAVSLVIR